MYLRDCNQTAPRPRKALADLVDETCAKVNADLARRARKPRRDAKLAKPGPMSVQQSLKAVRAHVDRMAEIVAIYKGAAR